MSHSASLTSRGFEVDATGLNPDGSGTIVYPYKPENGMPLTLYGLDAKTVAIRVNIEPRTAILKRPGKQRATLNLLFDLQYTSPPIESDHDTAVGHGANPAKVELKNKIVSALTDKFRKEGYKVDELPAGLIQFSLPDDAKDQLAIMTELWDKIQQIKSDIAFGEDPLHIGVASTPESQPTEWRARTTPRPW